MGMSKDMRSLHYDFVDMDTFHECKGVQVWFFCNQVVFLFGGTPLTTILQCKKLNRYQHYKNHLEPTLAHTIPFLVIQGWPLGFGA